MYIATAVVCLWGNQRLSCGGLAAGEWGQAWLEARAAPEGQGEAGTILCMQHEAPPQPLWKSRCNKCIESFPWLSLVLVQLQPRQGQAPAQIHCVGSVHCGLNLARSCPGGLPAHLPGQSGARAGPGSRRAGAERACVFLTAGSCGAGGGPSWL